MGAAAPLAAPAYNYEDKMINDGYYTGQYDNDGSYDDAWREPYWEALRKEAGGDEEADRIVDALKKLYSMYSNDLIRWYANLYEPTAGAYYCSTSGKENEGFLPDVESTVQALNSLGCNVTVVPYDTTAEAILLMKPDGVLISGGPGAPDDVAFIADEIKKIVGKVPVFGVGLGHELIGMAYGAKAYKLKFGHHGGNHPIKTLATGNIETVSQNHNYAIDADSVNGTKLTVTKVNILDGVVAGLACEEDKVFSVQYHPQISTGPNGRIGAYEQFIALMKEEN